MQYIFDVPSESWVETNSYRVIFLTLGSHTKASSGMIRIEILTQNLNQLNRFDGKIYKAATFQLQLSPVGCGLELSSLCSKPLKMFLIREVKQ